MDQNLEKQFDLRIQKLEKACLKNQYDFDVVDDEAGVREFVRSLLKPGDLVSVGGSMSLFETGVISMLEHMPEIDYLDRYHTNDTQQVFHEAFNADVYLTSTNAITMQGELYNVDGNGNRVAAMIYGPKKVVVIIGINKIVEDHDAAVSRAEKIAAPANAIRLNKDTPCATIGECVNCQHQNRICNNYVTIRRSSTPGRIHIILVKKDLGY